MAREFEDSVQDVATSTGTGPFIMAGTPPQTMRPFSVHTVGASFEYKAFAGAQWEIGDGTWDGTNIARSPRESSSGNALVNFATAPTVWEIVTAATIKRAVMGGDAPFSQAVPLSAPGTTYMAAKTVAGPLTFTPAANAVRNALVYLRMTADGANVPSFSAFKEWGSSSGYDNRAGIVNQVQFFCDGVDNWVNVSQAVGATPAPTPATATTLSGPTAGAVGTASSVFNVGANGTLSGAVTWTASDNGGGGTFSATSGAVPGSFTYTATSTGAKTIGITNNGGLTNPANITYTASASATAPSAPTIGAATPGDGYIDFAFTAPASNGGASISGYTLTVYKAADNSVVGTFTSANSPTRATGLTNGVSYYGKEAATNSVNTGPQSAQSANVSPVAAVGAGPATTVRLNRAVAKVTETNAQPWKYSGTGGVGTDGSVGAVSVVSLPASTNGAAIFRVDSVANDFMVQIGNTAVVDVYNNNDCIWNSAGVYKVIPNGGGGVKTPTAVVTSATGDWLKIERIDADTAADFLVTSVYSVSKDSGTTWTELWRNSTGRKLPYYAKVVPAGASTLSCVTTVGFA